MNQQKPLEFINPNTAWVMRELDDLYSQWVKWSEEVYQIKDQKYDKNTQTEVFADGEQMMLKHDILQAKTLTFLNNNISGHGFIVCFDGNGCDRTDLRLKYRVKHRIHNLDLLISSLKYARVPDSFWRIKGKELVDKIIDKGGDAAVDVAASYLKNPLEK